jgi:cell division septal protein FtsQ
MVRRVYQDQLRKKRRRKFLLKLLAVTGVVFLFLGGIIYLSFFAGLFDVRTIDISEAEVISSADLRTVDLSRNSKASRWTCETGREGTMVGVTLAKVRTEFRDRGE